MLLCVVCSCQREHFELGKYRNWQSAQQVEGFQRQVKASKSHSEHVKQQRKAGTGDGSGSGSGDGSS